MNALLEAALCLRAHMLANVRYYAWVCHLPVAAHMANGERLPKGLNDAHG